MSYAGEETTNRGAPPPSVADRPSDPGIFVLAATVGLFYVISGGFPAVALPGLGEISAAAIIPIGLTLGAATDVVSGSK